MIEFKVGEELSIVRNDDNEIWIIIDGIDYVETHVSLNQAELLADVIYRFIEDANEAQET